MKPNCHLLIQVTTRIQVIWIDQVLRQKSHPKNVHFKRRDGKPLKWKESTKDFTIHKDVEKALARMEEVMMEEMMVEEIKLEDELWRTPKSQVRPKMGFDFLK